MERMASSSIIAGTSSGHDESRGSPLSTCHAAMAYSLATRVSSAMLAAGRYIHAVRVSAPYGKEP